MRSAILLLIFPPLLAGYLLGVALAFDTSEPLPQYLLMVPLVYILGSVPWGFMIIRLSQGVDIREYGSGRIGTSNVLRTAGPRVAGLVLTLDLSKGVLAVLLARAIVDTTAAEVVAGLLVLVGHNWSLFLGFKGGRGIAPGTGAMAIISPAAIALGIGLFALTAFSTKYVSLASLVAVVTVLVVTSIQVTITDFSPLYLIYVGAGGLMIFWQHRDNIYRLLRGTERRLGKPADKLVEQG